MQKQQEDMKQAGSKYKDGEGNTTEQFNLWQTSPGAHIVIPTSTRKRK